MTTRLTNDFVTVREASRHLATVIARAQEGHPQVITRSGRPAAVLMKRRFSPDSLPEADFAQYADMEEPLADKSR